MAHQRDLPLSAPWYLKRLLGLGVLFAAFALDQAHKFWMIEVFDIASKQPITLTPFLDLVMSWNFGVSYSLFAAHDGAAREALLLVQSAIVAGLLVWMLRSTSRATVVGLGLIAGGALGNVADRFTRGAVADFFYFHTSLPVGPLANYVFNVADVAITLGVMLLMWESFSVAEQAAEKS